MSKRCQVILCVIGLALLSADVVVAGTFNVANYTATNLGGVPYAYSYTNPRQNFLAFNLTEQGNISGYGYWMDLTSAPPALNPKVMLQCNEAGFGPANYTIGTDGQYHSANYDDSGLPKTGIYHNTGMIFNNDYLDAAAATDSGTFAYLGGSTFPSGSATGRLWSPTGGETTPAAIAGCYTLRINNNGLVVGGDYDALSGWGNTGVAYDSVHGTSTALPGAGLYVNNAGQVSGVSANCTQGWVWNQNASAYWPAGATNVTGLSNAQSISQNGRYVAGFQGAYGASISGCLYDASTHSVLKSISGEAYAVNDNAWLGGDTDSTWGGSFNGTAWLWDGTSQHDLNAELHAQFPSVVTADFTVCAVWGINNSGQILVWGKTAGTPTIESFLLSGMLGDANIDGKVDTADLSKILTNYSKTGMTWAEGDFDANGSVDITDLSKVLTNYNRTVGAGAVKAVPEPSTLALACAGLLALLAFAWRRQK